MSADVRALLKAKTQERAKRINHPFAAYSAAGQLRCTLCATIVKDNEVAWSGHLGSKAHRTNVGRQKEAMKREEEKVRLEKGKRKALGDEEDDEEDGMDVAEGENLRVGAQAASKRQKTEEEQRPSANAANFFSDPSRALPTGEEADEETAAPSSKPAPASQIDLEWAQFERDVLAPPTRPSNGEDPPLSKKEIYDRATVVMEEEVRYDGFPGDAQPTTSGTTDVVGEYVGGAPIEETPEQTVVRKTMEEKELIMDRILDEERAQEEADEKVRAVKARFAALRKKREDAKSKGGS